MGFAPEPIELADHLRVSLIERLKKLAEDASVKVAAAPPPAPVIPSLSPAEKQARWRRAMPAVYKISEMLYGRKQGMAEKVAHVLTLETFCQSARDLGDWAPRSPDVIQSVLQQSGVKTAQDADVVTADYMGRLMAHGLFARHIEKLSEDPAQPWWQRYGFLTDPSDPTQITGQEWPETRDLPASGKDPEGNRPMPDLRGSTTVAP